MLQIILATIALIAIYLYVTKPYKYWLRKNVAHPKPWPLFGNMASNVFQRQSVAHLVENVYKSYPAQRYVGFYQFLKPTLLIRDPDLIKQITVKDFDAFPDHKTFSSSSEDIFATKNLLNLTAAKGWHNARSTISPAFTSSKIRMMFLLVQQCVDQFVTYFREQKGTITVDTKDVYVKFAVDVISTTTLGVVCNSLQNPENKLYRLGKNLSTVTFSKNLKFFAFTISPTLLELLGISNFGKDMTEFFRNVVKETIRVREEKQIIRQDLLHLLIEARKGRLKHEDDEDDVVFGFAVSNVSDAERTHRKPKVKLTDEEIAAESFGLFFAGFETVSTLLSFATYELALNPDIQKKLYEEIRVPSENGDGKITYETLLGMKYLDCVISEALRKWPPGAFVDRCSAKPFIIEPVQPGEKPLHLEAGSIVWIPIYAIHRDPKYYPDPEKFNPERFNDENKRNIKPFTYLPFGSGPRICLGSRLALLEAKLLLATLLRQFELVPVAKTPVPVQHKKNSFLMLQGKDVWIGYKPRTV